MSTKTLRKRIALVAVSALGAGLLSVVAVPSANATAIPGGITLGANVATDASVLNATSGTTRSTGVIGITTNSTASIDAIMYTWGTLSGAVDALASGAAYATITGGYFSANTGGTANAARTKITGAATTAFGFYAKPSGAGTMIIQSFNASDTLVSQATVVVTATNATGAYSPTYTTVYWGAGGGSDTATTDGTSSNSSKANAGVCAGDIKIKDAYAGFLANSTGVVTATVTGGGLVNLDHASTAGTSAVDFSTTTSANIPFNVRQATANKAATLTVVIKFDETVVATKTCKITGEVATVTASAPKIGKSGGTNTAAATIAYADAAGNAVYPTSGTSVVSTSVGVVITNVTVGTYPTNAPQSGALTVTCSSVGGKQSGLQMKHINASGTAILSNTWDQSCADVPYTVNASWDKASYTPGSIAKLTLTFKDADGNLANAYDAVGANSANAVMTVTGGPSATAVTPIAAADKPSYSTGQVTYDYVVGTTEGDFVAVIVPTEVKENNALATNISLAYSVKSTSTAVSNADVLKAIVSLIASINKQIAALQKALLKKK
jgi:trimeric autotransporter adhesin